MNPGSRPSGSATRLQHITLPAPPRRPTVTIREQGSGFRIKKEVNTRKVVQHTFKKWTYYGNYIFKYEPNVMLSDN